MITPSVIVSLLLILSVTWILGVVFSRFGLSPVPGELLAAVILGPPILGIVIISPSIEMLAELGVFFVMFNTGLELDPKELLEHIKASISVAVGGFVLPFSIGSITVRWFGGDHLSITFCGNGFVNIGNRPSVRDSALYENQQE